MNTPPPPLPAAPPFSSVEEAEAYDRWYRAKIAKALADTRPDVPHDKVIEKMQMLLETEAKSND
jgi:hypothetical protein